jgi:hypothetical protein
MIVTGALLAVLLAGCGSKPSQKVYSLAKTKACLEAQPVRLGGALDFVASTATGGSVKVHTRNNFVTIVFGTDVADADNINSAYHHFAAKNVGVDDVLDQSGNAVMLWHKHPSQSDVDVVQSCLK